jgi:hypothetical protein
MKWWPRSRARVRAPVPLGLWFLFGVVLLSSMAWQTWRYQPSSALSTLGEPPSAQVINLLGLGDSVPVVKVMNLLLQAHDVQPGLSLSFRSLDYPQITRWLARSLELDPVGQYPLLAASRLYTQQPDLVRKRIMVDFVAKAFEDDPGRRWQWMAHVAGIAKSDLKDTALALALSERLRLRTEHLEQVPAWARQMEIFLRLRLPPDQSDQEIGKALLGALIQNGQIKDPKELQFLIYSLEEAEKNGKQQ